MANFKNIRFLSLFIVFINFCFSQDKVMVPLSGTITFIKQDTIYDKELYLKSFKDLLPQMKIAMKNEVYLERLSNGIKTDTIALNNEVDKSIKLIESMLPLFLDEENEQLFVSNTFKDNQIIKFYERNGEQLSTTFISTTTNTIKNEVDEYIEIDENEILDLQENRNEVKLINGFECFKVIYSFKEANYDNGFDLFNEIFGLTKREMWVTTDIKCNYHPVINERKILDTYYPLEVIDFPSNIKGIFTTYKLKLFDIR